jgi:hypothetical protein
MTVASYSPTPALNTSISGIDISEGSAAAGYNNALRQIMADIAVWTAAYAVTYPISVANGGTGAGTAAAALTALGAFPAAGGTVAGASTFGSTVAVAGSVTHTGNGVLPYFASTSMTGGKIYVQASGADPTANPGDVVYEY